MRARTQRSPKSREKPSAKTKRVPPAILYRDGKPAFVLLDIKDYRDMLDRLDDLEDIEFVDSLPQERPPGRPFEDYVAEKKRG